MIIDFHTHIFPDAIARSTIEALSKSASIPPHSDGTATGLRAQMSKAEVDIAINLPVLTKAKQFDSIVKFAQNLNLGKECPSIISFAGMHPDIEDYESKLEEIKALGFLGIKLHPDYQGTFIDDERYIKILAYAKKLDLITVTHAGLDGAFVGQPIKCTPLRTLKLLDALGGYDKLVLAHMGGNELFDEVLNELAGESVYFDTSYVLSFIGQDMFEKILARHGEDKILFATDSPWQDECKEISLLRSFKLGDKVNEKIFSQNAIKLLNLEV